MRFYCSQVLYSHFINFQYYYYSFILIFYLLTQTLFIPIVSYINIINTNKIPL